MLSSCGSPLCVEGALELEVHSRDGNPKDLEPSCTSQIHRYPLRNSMCSLRPHGSFRALELELVDTLLPNFITNAYSRWRSIFARATPLGKSFDFFYKSCGSSKLFIACVNRFSAPVSIPCRIRDK